MNRSVAQMLPAAVALAAEVHHGQCRDEGTPYIEHPIRVALIAAQELEIGDAELLAVAYLHDTVEDADQPEEMRRRIREQFGERVLAAVETLTKSSDPSVPEEQRNREYHGGILAAPREVQALKLADRLDNVRSLIGCPDSGKRNSYLEETEEKYLPLARETGLLVEPLQRAIARVREAGQ